MILSYNYISFFFVGDGGCGVLQLYEKGVEDQRISSELTVSCFSFFQVWLFKPVYASKNLGRGIGQNQMKTSED